MDIEIIEEPVRFHLHGTSDVVPGNAYGETGMRLMDAMWKVVRGARTSSTGINHWVYLPDDRMFVGIELLPDAEAPAGLEELAFELPRCLKHLHFGPFDALPAKWTALKERLIKQGEVMSLPSLEVYGHHCADAAKQETTILIGLQPRQA